MKNKIIFISLLSAMLMISSGIPEKNKDVDAVSGKIIVQLRLQDQQKDILNELEAVFSYAGLQAERCLSDDLGIWLLVYDTQVKGEELLSKLRSDQMIAKAQLEHYITQRDVLPNDPSFAMQWALFNLGQTGGVVDADIDATKAWEISVNNGIGAMGDTLVIAVVDDGFYLEHEDMNFWKNHNEIPDNGIDDDSNGYVDDYDGWNAYNGSGTITSKSHGTKVAGVAGAVGNNELGVSGIGWNCKVMPVAGNSTFESTVVEAYAYVYKMRALYEETDGEKGAFIVATNSSFGVDFANIEDYPIWGMMYDSLGSLGILSAAATMNSAWDVDIVGDVPTNFESDHLITVTNTTYKDVKYNSAAWGEVSIDLGAPGTNILSTKVNNSYGYSTGTSLASPHVAGGIALIYSAADEAFMQNYKEQAAEVALFVKNLMIYGVDSLQGFDTLCVSGGRLNVDKAVRSLLVPRIEAETDTISLFLGPDSTGSKSLGIQNLAGFELPYTCSIVEQPTWIGFDPVSGVLAPHGSSHINLDFDAGGMTTGNNYCKILLEDIGGKQVEVIAALKVIPNMGTSDDTQANKTLISAFPNPFSNQLRIKINNQKSSSLQLQIYALTGKLVYEWSAASILSGEQFIGWDGKDQSGKNIPAGVYIIRLLGDGFSDQMKVIKSQ